MIFHSTHLSVYLSWPSEKSVRYGPRRTRFNPSSSHTKDSKMVQDASLLNTRHYKVRIKGKWRNPEKGVAPSPIPRCSSKWNRSLQVALDDRHQILQLYIYRHRHRHVDIDKNFKTNQREKNNKKNPTKTKIKKSQNKKQCKPQQISVMYNKKLGTLPQIFIFPFYRTVPKMRLIFRYFLMNRSLF